MLFLHYTRELAAAAKQ